MLPIHLSYRHTEADYQDFINYHLTKGRGRRSLLIMGGAMVAGTGFLIAKSEDPFPQNVLYSIIPVLVFGVMWWFVFRWSMRRALKVAINGSPQFWEQREVEIDAEGVKIQAETFNTDYLWKGVLKIVETEATFLVFNSPQSALVLPKRAFSTEQIEALRPIVQKSVNG